MFISQFFCQNDCKIILLTSFLSILFYEVNVRGHLPGEAVSLHKSLMYVELGIHCFHIFLLVSLNWLQMPHRSLYRDVACVCGFSLI